MGDGTNFTVQRQQGGQASKPKQSLRSLLRTQPAELVIVPAVESDHWLQAESEPRGAEPVIPAALRDYVERARAIGLAIQKNRASAGEPAAAQPRRGSLPPPPPPARRSTPGGGLPLLDAEPAARARVTVSGPSPANLGRLRAQAASAQLGAAATDRPPSAAVPQPAAASGPRDHELREVQERLQHALVRVRQQQVLVAEAERRARSAEQWMMRYSQVHAPAQLAPRSRLLRHGSALLVFFVAAFVVGGYISLLGPVRKRVLMHEAALRELGASQQQLTHQNQALLQQLAQSSSAAP